MGYLKHLVATAIVMVGVFPVASDAIQVLSSETFVDRLKKRVIKQSEQIVHHVKERVVNTPAKKIGRARKRLVKSIYSPLGLSDVSHEKLEHELQEFRWSKTWARVAEERAAQRRRAFAREDKRQNWPLKSIIRNTKERNDTKEFQIVHAARAETFDFMTAFTDGLRRKVTDIKQLEKIYRKALPRAAILVDMTLQEAWDALIDSQSEEFFDRQTQAERLVSYNPSSAEKQVIAKLELGGIFWTDIREQVDAARARRENFFESFLGVRKQKPAVTKSTAHGDRSSEQLNAIQRAMMSNRPDQFSNSDEEQFFNSHESQSFFNADERQFVHDFKKIAGELEQLELNLNEFEGNLKVKNRKKWNNGFDPNVAPMNRAFFSYVSRRVRLEIC